LKEKGITALFTNMASDMDPELAHKRIASLIDTWILVKNLEGNGERNRALYVLKSRGMAHSNQIREFLITDRGIELADVYVGEQGVLTGSARSAQEAKERSEATERQEDLEQRRVNLARRRDSVEAQTATLWREYDAEADIVGRLVDLGLSGGEERAEQRAEQGRLRRADPTERVPPKPARIEPAELDERIDPAQVAPCTGD
jgi:circadian clock protein KaiC